MIYKMSQQLKTIKGTPLKEQGEDGELTPITLGAMACSSLLTHFKDETNLSGDEKAKRYKLCMRIVDQNEVDLSIEEIALVKKLIGKHPSALCVGQAFDMLESADELSSKRKKSEEK